MSRKLARFIRSRPRARAMSGRGDGGQAWECAELGRRHEEVASGMTWGDKEARRWWIQHHPPQALSSDAIYARRQTQELWAHECATVITTLPFLCPCSTYLKASAMRSRG